MIYWLNPPTCVSIINNINRCV